MKIVQKKTLEKLNVFKGFLAHLPGFEPGTFRLGGGRSILLSYKCIFGFFSTIDLSLRRRTLYPAELRVHYLTGVIVALQTEVVKSKNSGSTNISSYENTGKFHKQMQYF